eukprot:Sspe_Gene.35066::Locus_17010_Transcript_1_1_Confidence_1.000_Length_894::g.35066::m.35066
MEETIRAALEIYPREVLRFTSLCTRHGGDHACAVDGVDADVSHFCTDRQKLFKVVSVVTPDDPMVVQHNVIYSRDVDQEVVHPRFGGLCPPWRSTIWTLAHEPSSSGGVHTALGTSGKCLPR